MDLVQQVLFTLLFAAAIFVFARKVRAVRRRIRLGRPVKISGDRKARWKGVLLLALGQRKMFRNWIPAVLHLFVYAGFIIINIEIAEIVLDGITGAHRMFAPLLGGLYGVLIGCFEVLAVLVIIGCVAFLARRNLLRIPRFRSREMTEWPRRDANYILVMEIILMCLFLTMNTADGALQLRHLAGYPETGRFWITGMWVPALSGLPVATLEGLERSAWWLHIAGVLFFLNYLPYSKHFHILLAFPNTFYRDLKPRGRIPVMPEIQKEVALMFDPGAAPAPEGAPPERFGAKDITDLSWKNLMDAYSCTECGRCTAACPANLTGKLLSPRKIMMDTRDRTEVLGRAGTAGDGRSLLHDYITAEELWACTTCNACVEECPVSINPLDIILQLRRYLIMDEANAPSQWSAMCANIETNMAPWKFPPEDRAGWIPE